MIIIGRKKKESDSEFSPNIILPAEVFVARTDAGTAHTDSIKVKTMERTSLEQFRFLVDTKYPEVKKYIITENEHHVVMEDPNGDCAFGSNKDLAVIFEWPCPLPVKKVSISYKEKDSCYLIQIDLK